MKKTIRETLLKLGYPANKPDFIIIGTQKGGTSGLFNILENHSCIIPSLTKEVHYFDNDNWYNENKIAQYHSFFPLFKKKNKYTKFFEATPKYIFHPKVASRLHSYNPNLKLILLLRDPAERAFSAWTMFHHHFKTGIHSHLYDPRSFSDAVSEEINNIEKESFQENQPSYVRRGIYHLQIEKYFSHFKKEQLLLIESKALRTQSDEVLKEIQSFIEVPYEKLAYVSSNTSKTNEKDKYIKDINKLRAFYKPHNDKLFKLIGKKYDWSANNS